MVERNLAKVDVAGSSPVSRSPNPDPFGIFFLCSYFFALILNSEFIIRNCFYMALGLYPAEGGASGLSAKIVLIFLFFILNSQLRIRN